MRKQIIDASAHPQPPQDPWLDLSQIASVEVTSEDPHFPIENALELHASDPWRAASPGPQTIRLRFDAPVSLRRIRLCVVDRASERNQEFALSVATPTGSLQEIRRQQFTFSQYGATEEMEDFEVTLPEVTVLELRIDPDRCHNPAHSHTFATLTSLRLG